MYAKLIARSYGKMNWFTDFIECNMQFGFKCTEIWIDYENQTQNNQLGFQLIKSIFVLFSQFYQLIHGDNEKQLLKLISTSNELIITQLMCMFQSNHLINLNRRDTETSRNKDTNAWMKTNHFILAKNTNTLKKLRGTKIIQRTAGRCLSTEAHFPCLKPKRLQTFSVSVYIFFSLLCYLRQCLKSFQYAFDVSKCCV